MLHASFLPCDLIGRILAVCLRSHEISEILGTNLCSQNWWVPESRNFVDFFFFLGRGWGGVGLDMVRDGMGR